MISSPESLGANHAYADEAEGEMDIRAIVAKLLAGKWWIIASVVVFTGAFIAAAILLTPIYRASTVLIPAKSDKDLDSGGGGALGGGGGIGSVASLVGINLGGGDSATEEALGVLKSRQFTDKFISDLNLMPVLYAKLWDVQAKKWKVDEKHQPTPAKAFKLFDKKIRTIVPEKKTSLITLNIDWTDRVAASAWANELVNRLNLEMRQRETARADAAVGYLEKEFETTNAVATREAIGRLIEAQVRQRMYATVTPEFAFRIIDKAQPPDRDDRFFPNKFLMAIAGPFVGLIFGVMCVFGYDMLKSPPDRRR
jgi:uncharacterized protein involved in exopolysaccharide biosynthesis